MKTYIGTKIIKAEEMDMDSFNTMFDRQVQPADNTEKEGYHVEYSDGYHSWSPKSTFDEAYRECSAMNFGLALEAAKKGAKIQRSGWNGKDMYIVYQKAYPDGIAIDKNTAEATGIPEGTVCKFRPYLMMKTVDSSFFPWNPNQLDMLADDWAILP